VGIRTEFDYPDLQVIKAETGKRELILLWKIIKIGELGIKTLEQKIRMVVKEG